MTGPPVQSEIWILHYSDMVLHHTTTFTEPMLFKAVATLAVALPLLQPATVNAALRESLDFGWRFHLGDPAQQDLCPPTAFAAFNSTFCEHWGHVNPHGGLALEFCRLACCGDPACAGWTWNHAGNTCYMGSSTDRCILTYSYSTTPSLLLVSSPSLFFHISTAWLLKRQNRTIILKTF